MAMNAIRFCCSCARRDEATVRYEAQTRSATLGRINTD
jgi:hypothetical protein